MERKLIRQQRRSPLCLLLMLPLAFLLMEVTSATAATYALLIGVNDYEDPEIDDLSGAVNDVNNLYEVLVRELAIPKDNIAVLKDCRATRARVVAELKKLSKAKPQDTVIIHFSGHGSKLPDDDGDESERAGESRLDAHDEVLCLYDTRKKSGKNALRDDELAGFLSAIEAAEVAVILDCCFAGGQAKSLGTTPNNGEAATSDEDFPDYLVRSMTLGDEPPGDKDVKKAGQPTARSLTNPAPTIETDPVGTTLSRSINDRTRLVVLSACSTMQEAIELHHREVLPEFYSGSLTHFLVQGLRGPADSNYDGAVTYSEAFDYTTKRLEAMQKAGRTPKQTPVLESSDESRTRPVLASATRQPLSAVGKADPQGTITIDLGAVHGIRRGEVLGVFRSAEDVEFGDRSIARFTVDRVDLMEATGTLNRDTDIPGDVVFARTAEPPLLIDVIAAQPAAGQSATLSGIVADRLAGYVNSLLSNPSVRFVDDDFDIQLEIRVSARSADRMDIEFAFNDCNGGRLKVVKHSVQNGLTQKRRDQICRPILTQFRELLLQARLRKFARIDDGPVKADAPSLVTLPGLKAGDTYQALMKSPTECWIHLIAIGPDGQHAPLTGKPLQLGENELAYFPDRGARMDVPEALGCWELRMVTTTTQLPAFSPNRPLPLRAIRNARLGRVARARFVVTAP